MLSRKEQEYLLKKNYIIQAAHDLFVEKDYDKVTMNEIAERSDFSRRTLYIYFKSKLDLLVEVIIKIFTDFEKEIPKLLEKEKDAYSQLYVFATKYYDFYKKNPAYYSLVQYFDVAIHKEYDKLSDTVKKDLRESSSDMENVLTKIIIKGKEELCLKEELKPDLAVTFFLKALFGIMHQYILHPKFDEECFFIELKYLLSALTN